MARVEKKTVMMVKVRIISLIEVVAEIEFPEGKVKLRPLNPKHHLTPTLSPTSWRRGRRFAVGSLSTSEKEFRVVVPFRNLF